MDTNIVVYWHPWEREFYMRIYVPLDRDKEEYIDDFLEEIMGDKMKCIEWDFA